MTNEIPPHGGPDEADPIVAAWAEQSEEAIAPSLSSDVSELAESVAAVYRKDQRRLFWLIVREVLPMPFIAGVFATSVPSADRPAAVIASVVLVLAVGAYLVTTSLRQHRADRAWGASVREQLERRLAQVQHRAQLYRSVLWWYFLPLLSAIVLFWWGSAIPEDDTGGSSAIFFAVLFVASIILYWVNRRIGRNQYEPEVERLSALLDEFDRTV